MKSFDPYKFGCKLVYLILWNIRKIILYGKFLLIYHIIKVKSHSTLVLRVVNLTFPLRRTMVTGFSLRPVTSAISYIPPNYRVRVGFRVSKSFPCPIRLSSKQMSTASAADANALASSDGRAENSDILVQYVVLRRDLIEKWPLGSIVTQGCHASVAAIWMYKEDPHTLQYCGPDNIDSMHKVPVPCSSFFSLFGSISLNLDGIL